MTVTINGTTGITTPSDTISGNLTFTGTGNRITGDFSNATVSNRVQIQTSTTNQNTIVGFIPNGTATQSSINLEADSAITNGAVLSISIGANSNTEARITSNARGSGTVLPMTFVMGSSEAMRIATTGGVTFSGTVGLGTSPTSNAYISVASAPSSNNGPVPINMASGYLSPLVQGTDGNIEYAFDEVNFGSNPGLYFTTLNGRGYIPNILYWRLYSAGSAIGPTISNFFGANSAVSLQPAQVFEIEAYLYFTKTTAGTVTVTLTSSVAPNYINAHLEMDAVAGGTAVGTPQYANIIGSTSAGAAFAASASLTTATNHLFIVKGTINTAGGAGAKNLRFNVTSSAGTVTPLAGSYYKILPIGPYGYSGNFVA
jgi:hypothetical protein